MDEIENITPADLAFLDEIVQEAHMEDNKDKVLPANSPTLLIDETTSRFSSAIWYELIQQQNVLLAGLGGIGSWCALLLGRLSLRRLILYDDDIVDATNMSGQLYADDNIGDYKVNCIRHMIQHYTNCSTIYSYTSRFNRNSPPTGIMICGFDNMKSRKEFYLKWKQYVSLHSAEKNKCLFIDGRLSVEEFQIFCITGEDTFLMEKYEKEWLFDDEEAEYEVCSNKQTSFCANMIASMMVNLFVNFIANQTNPLIKRELPFYTNYDAERMYFKTENI